MNKIEDKLIVHTITKTKFNRLSKANQRIAVIQDVLDRIKLGQLIARTGDFCYLKTQGDVRNLTQLSEKLKSLDLTCEVCAKGGLFMSYIGIVNNYEVPKQNHSIGSADIKNNEMLLLSKIISPRQLALIETAFEGTLYHWNVALTEKEECKARIFYNKYCTDEKRLIAICNNMLKHDGIFIP